MHLKAGKPQQEEEHRHHLPHFPASSASRLGNSCSILDGLLGSLLTAQCKHRHHLEDIPNAVSVGGDCQQSQQYHDGNPYSEIKLFHLTAGLQTLKGRGPATVHCFILFCFFLKRGSGCSLMAGQLLSVLHRGLLGRRKGGDGAKCSTTDSH